MRDSHIAESGVVTPEDTVLVAVSGGVDSVVLLHRLLADGLHCAVAHVNFGLRGEESDADEAFVSKLAAEYGIPLHLSRVDCESHAKKHKLSVQMAARELRYQFFEETRKAWNYSHIATAHHADDNLETFFIYLIRNNTEAAWKGISEKNGHIIRPLLGIGRDEIVLYALENKLEWREDSSNKKDKYLRNKIRHMIIPWLKQEFPGVLEEYFQLANQYRDWDLSRTKRAEELFNTSLYLNGKNQWKFHGNISDIEFRPALINFLRSLGYSSSQINQMYEARTGAEFHSKKYILFIDTKGFSISIKSEITDREFVVFNDKDAHHCPPEMVIDFTSSVVSGSESATEYFDSEKIHFPLRIRHWRNGDKMIPLGVSGHKKLSDIFSDKKVGRLERATSWVIEDGSGILAVLGVCRSNKALLSENTRKVMKIKLVN